MQIDGSFFANVVLLFISKHIHTLVPFGALHGLMVVGIEQIQCCVVLFHNGKHLFAIQNCSTSHDNGNGQRGL